MSSYQFPLSLPGLRTEKTRTYVWSTNIQPAVSGKETRIKLAQYPRVRYTFTYELLRNNISPSALKDLVGLFNALNGSFDTCLLVDPDFNSVTDENFGTGDGTTTAFQLTATFKNAGSYGAPEAIQNLTSVTNVKANGSVVSSGAYTLGPTGIVTFSTPPTAGHALTWTGSFYYRVRFDSDELELGQFLTNWWTSREITLISVRL